MWGFVILDLLISVWIWVGVPLPIPIGLLIDFATGAIYKPLRLMGPTDLAPDDESLPEEDDGARRTVDGEMLAILVPFCEEGNRFLTEAGPDRLIAAAITFREHIETCKTCAGALLALGRPSRIKRPSADGTVISNEPLPVRLTAGTVVSPEAYAQLRESADAPSLFSVPT